MTARVEIEEPLLPCHVPRGTEGTPSVIDVCRLPFHARAITHSGIVRLAHGR